MCEERLYLLRFLKIGGCSIIVGMVCDGEDDCNVSYSIARHRFITLNFENGEIRNVFVVKAIRTLGSPIMLLLTSVVENSYPFPDTLSS